LIVDKSEVTAEHVTVRNAAVLGVYALAQLVVDVFVDS
jgi:hypothetical protein